jgi:hypothetical protein
LRPAGPGRPGIGALALLPALAAGLALSLAAFLGALAALGFG